jgi:hypothetical protein
MNVKQIAQLITVTIALVLGLGASFSFAFRTDIAANWEAKRCEPGVVPIAGVFKPTTDPRTRVEFAAANARHCEGIYVKEALRAAAAAPRELMEASSDVAGLAEDAADAVGDLFVNLWNFCYSAYSSFQDRMKGAAKLFHNFMIQLHSITERLQGAVLSIVFGLMSLIVAYLSSVQLILIVAIVIIGILIALQIILFFVLLPISGLIISMTALVAVVVVSVATAIAAATVAEMFTPGVCFAAGTPVLLVDGTTTKPIEAVRNGDVVAGGGVVTAVHHFRSSDTLYDLRGVQVTGDHLVVMGDSSHYRLAPVREHPEARAVTDDWLGRPRDLWCLTTSSRRIPVRSDSDSGLGHGSDSNSNSNSDTVWFADWEEIDEDDDASLAAWYSAVWRELNGPGPSGPSGPSERSGHGPSERSGPSPVVIKPPARVLDAEAGLAPDCLVACPGWFGQRTWRRIMDIATGDRVFDAEGAVTTVVGRVVIAGDQSTDAVLLPVEEGMGPQIVSCATWLRRDHLWAPAALQRLTPCELHPVHWEHLYTESGTFILAGDWAVRDASDVGLGSLHTLVEDVVLTKGATPC